MEDNFSTKPVPGAKKVGDRFRGRQFFHGVGGRGDGSGGNESDAGDGSGGNESDGGAADEASLARPPLTSCCAARFLTGPRPGGWAPCSKQPKINHSQGRENENPYLASHYSLIYPYKYQY